MDPRAPAQRADERDPDPGGDRVPDRGRSRSPCRRRNILATGRGTTIIYSVADPELFELLDVARRLFNAHLADTIDLLRLVEDEGVAAGER
jgi:hypothetical protein